jgi:hypothetical protein
MRYASSAAFRRALEDRLKERAAGSNQQVMRLAQGSHHLPAPLKCELYFLDSRI